MQSNVKGLNFVKVAGFFSGLATKVRNGETVVLALRENGTITENGLVKWLQERDYFWMRKGNRFVIEQRRSYRPAA